jgi:hypothetical protein
MTDWHGLRIRSDPDRGEVVIGYDLALAYGDPTRTAVFQFAVTDPEALALAGDPAALAAWLADHPERFVSVGWHDELTLLKTAEALAAVRAALSGVSGAG